jgi:hypothetical protein
MPRPLARTARAISRPDASFELTEVGLTVADSPSPTYDAWAAYGASLYRLGNLSKWAIGDWLVYGEYRYPDAYSQAIDGTQRALGTLQNIASVCRAFPHPERRPELSFSHHQAVIGCMPSERARWLQQAVAQHWSVRELRAQFPPAGFGSRFASSGSTWTERVARTSAGTTTVVVNAVPVLAVRWVLGTPYLYAANGVPFVVLVRPGTDITQEVAPNQCAAIGPVSLSVVELGW